MFNDKINLNEWPTLTNYYIQPTLWLILPISDWFAILLTQHRILCIKYFLSINTTFL